MKRLIPILLALTILIPSSAGSWGVVGMSGGVAAVAGNECTGLLLCQNFETPGIDNGETWTFTDGGAATWTTNYATSPAPLRGSYSGRLNAAGESEPSYVTVTLSAPASQIWIHFMYRKLVADDGGGGDSFVILDASNNTLAGAYWNDALVWTIFVEGGTTQNESGFLPVGTTYHIWMRYKAGSGANAEFDVYRGTTTSRPAITADLGDGTSMASAAKIRFYCRNTVDYVIDQILVDDAEFTTVAN